MENPPCTTCKYLYVTTNKSYNLLFVKCDNEIELFDVEDLEEGCALWEVRNESD